MKLLGLVLFGAVACWAGTPKLIFTKSFPGSSPPFVFVSVDQAGALRYKESLKDDQPVTAQLPDVDTAALFSMARQLNYFKMPLESGLKVANTGKKTFRYEDESGAATGVTFNYSTNQTAQQLLERFEQIAESERAYMDLDRTVHFDKLGVNDALAEIESLWLQKQLAAPKQFIPLFNRIIGHESYMHLVRERASRLKDEFEAPAAAVSEAQKTK